MAIPLDPKQIVSFEEPSCLRKFHRKPSPDSLLGKGIFTKRELWGKVVDRERRKKSEEGSQDMKIDLRKIHRPYFLVHSLRYILHR
jgi:hypothetical protein